MAEANIFYLVVPESSAPLELAIGIVGLKGGLRTTDGTVHTDLNGDGHQEYFTECSTSEGVQFNVWSNAPYKNKALWSAYYYLGLILRQTARRLRTSRNGRARPT